ncbi:MAG: pilus assembly protein [Planctomycetes bacterium]|nr:pilus assembly protein [Planctomycetota bacterium]
MQNLIVQKRQQPRRGAVAVEFAFIAPMLLAIVLGMIELTRVYDAQYLLQTAAREGARFAAMDREGMLANGQTGNSKLTSDVTSFLASAGIPSGDVQVDILDHDDPNQTFDIDDPANDLRLFRVEITVPFSSVSYTPVSAANDYNLTGAITFRNGRATLSQ